MAAVTISSDFGARKNKVWHCFHCFPIYFSWSDGTGCPLWNLNKQTLESPLNSKEIKPVNPKGNQPWIFIGRTDAEAETPIRWPPDVKSWLTGKDPGAEKDWEQEEKWVKEDEIVGWHHQLNGHEFEQTPGDSGGQGILACYSPWSGKESDKTEQLNNNNKQKRELNRVGRLLSYPVRTAELSSWKKNSFPGKDSASEEPKTLVTVSLPNPFMKVSFFPCHEGTYM